MIIKITLLLLWIALALIEGARDAFYFHNRITATNPDKKNMHWLFTLERFIVLSLIAWIYSLSFAGLDTGVFIFSLILIFSWVHNGQYYRVRNRLNKNVYTKKWFDNSYTSESLMEFNIMTRTFLAFVGLVGIITALTF